MKVEFSKKKLREEKADLELVFVVGKNVKHRWVKDGELFARTGFAGEAGEMELLPERGRLYVGVKSSDHDDLRIACSEAARFLAKKKYKSLKAGVYGAGTLYASLKAMAEGFLLGAYEFDEYKSKKNGIALAKAVICNEDCDNKEIDAKEAAAAMKEAEIISRSVNFVRGLVNKTPEDVTPLTMSEIAKGVAKNSGKAIGIIVYGEKYLVDEGMGAFLAVSKASPYPPQLIHLSYKPKLSRKKIVLVGKGLTYDTGGLSLKPGDAMLTMKMDKAGACAIFGIMQAVAELRLPIEVHGIVGAAENAIGKHAYKPDDVLRAKNGKTIEVRNTDAEGRLVLADCLCYAQDLKPDYIVDIATLTGACIVALGEYTIGVMGHGGELKDAIRESGKRSGELTAELPFNRYLPALLKSDVADISNVGSGKWGGAITAALFLSEFIEEKNKDKWAHLDIAGPAYKGSSWGENPIGASGAGVRLLVDWLGKLSKK